MKNLIQSHFLLNDLLCILLLISFFSFPCFSQPNYQEFIPAIKYSDNQYRIEDIGGSYDLNSSEVSALFQDKDGFIWVGNQPGLSRFDGYEFNDYTLADGRLIGQINAIVQDSSDIIWAGGKGGLFWYEYGQFHPALIGNYHIKDLHLDEAGKLWVVGLDFVPIALTSYERENIKLEKSNYLKSIVSEEVWRKTLGSLNTWAVDTDQDDNAWFGMDNGTAFFDGKQIHINWQDTIEKEEYCTIAAFHRDSVFWGTEKKGMMLQSNGIVKKIILPSVSYIVETTDTSTYFFTSADILELKNGKWSSLVDLGDYKYIYPKKMILDREGNFWVGGVGNLLKVSPIRVHSWIYPSIPLLASNHGITGLPGGKILIGSYGGRVVKKDDGGFTALPRLNVASYSYVSDIHVDNRNWIWFATSASGIVVNQGKETSYLTKADGLTENPQLFFYKSKNGGLWAGGENSITHIHVDDAAKISINSYPTESSEKAEPIFRDILENPMNSIWAISEKGLYKLKEKELVHQDLIDMPTRFPVFTGATSDLQNRIWLTTQGQGLWQCRFNDDNQLQLINQWTTKNGLLSNVLLDVHLDKWGRIWTVAQNGVSYLSMKDDTWEIRTIDQHDGWPSLATSRSEFHESDDSLLWVLNFTSLQAIPLYNLPRNQVKPQSFITNVQLSEGREDIFKYAENDLEDGGLPQQLKLSYNKNSLRFHFTTTSNTQMEKNKFFYRLSGLDQKWNESQGSRNILFSGLQPGDYTFEVFTINNDGIKGTKIANYAFLIMPPWYKTWWAYIMMTIILVSGVIFFYNLHLSHQLAQQETQRLQELDVFKSRFYANITHEFRTPLTVIQGMADELEKQPQKEPKEKITLIKKNSQNLLKLVNQMLELSKFKSGKILMHKKQGDIIAFLKYISETHESFAKLRNIDLQFYSEEEQLLMDFDEKKMEQVMVNLIANAIKFTPEYGKILVVAKNIQQRPPILEIIIKDTGKGISPEQLPYIFDRFHQNPTQKTSAGTGIGLAIVKELIALMDGKIDVKSKLHRGTTFSITLKINNKKPLVVNKYNNSIQKPVLLQSDSTNSTTKTKEDYPFLLIIEDNPDVTYYLKTCLEEEYKILTAVNGKEGIEKAFVVQPDIIISDVMMPKMSGFEVCQILKKDERTNHIPIILLTAKATSKDKLEGFSHGADAYLLKPFEKEELLVRLDNLMKLRQLLQIKYSQNLLNDVISTGKEEDITDAFMIKVEKIILNNLADENFSSQELSKALHLSRSQVHRKIKALTGKSLAIYIRHIRLQTAKKLLMNRDLTISEVAYQAGFKSPVYFSQVFKEVFGKSPSQWLV